jgi:cob(I)alamin adenosyltransferase
MLYTRNGDAGTSGLLETKERVAKDAPIYDALGTLDELNSLLGVCRARASRETGGVISIEKEVCRAQQRLFIIQAELAGAEKFITTLQVEEIETVIGRIEALAGNPHAFVISGATELSGLLDYARAVSRRAERAVIGVKKLHPVSPPTAMYLNRLSSLLYALARYAAHTANAKELSPLYET